MKTDLHICENCLHTFEEKDMEYQGEDYGWWCDNCLEKTPGNTSGYCSVSCQLGYGCDQSC